MYFFFKFNKTNLLPFLRFKSFNFSAIYFGSGRDKNTRINGIVGGVNDEHILLRSHLIDNAIGDTVEFVKEQHAGRSVSRLVKQHGDKVGTLDRDKVDLILVGNGLGEQRLTTAGRSVEDHTAGRLDAKLEELVGMLDWVLHQFL